MTSGFRRSKLLKKFGSTNLCICDYKKYERKLAVTKTGIIVLSFGIADRRIRDLSTSVLLEDMRKAFPGFLIREAFCSRALREKIFDNEGEKVLSLQEALEKFKEEGKKRVIVQPAFLMEGEEYEGMSEVIKQYKNDFEFLESGRSATTKLSSKKLSDALMSGIVAKDEVTVLAGHGSLHRANSMYFSVNEELHKGGFTKAFIGTFESKPDIFDVLEFLKGQKEKNITLMPFLSLAGNHASKDIFGEENSYLRSLKDAGYEVRCIKKGLCEYKEIRNLWLEAAKEQLEKFPSV